MKPFKQAWTPPEERERIVEEHMTAWRAGNKEARELTPALDASAAEAMLRSELNKMFQEETIWRNDKYQVSKRLVKMDHTGWPCDMIHLSIKRNDRSTIHDWRELQEIKNELVGPDHEAVELYPMESRKVDTANQYHLWVLAQPRQQFPFGYERRLVMNSTYGRAVNRPL
jgi:hypothetical protein